MQHDRSPSAVTERFAEGQVGLHHLACLVPSLDTALARAGELGLTVAQTARAGSTTFVFVDDVATSGHYWELYEPSPGLLGFYAMVRDASDGWDGTEPVQTLGGR